MYKAFLTENNRLLVVHKTYCTSMFYLNNQTFVMQVPDSCYEGKFSVLKVFPAGSFNSVEDIEHTYPEHAL